MTQKLCISVRCRMRPTCLHTHSAPTAPSTWGGTEEFVAWEMQVVCQPCRFRSCSACLCLSSSHRNTALVWSLLLASIHPPVPSVMLSLPDTCSRLSPEGRLTRGWCTLAFPTSDWNVYTGIFCRWKMGEHPNVRERFDVNTSNTSKYFTDKMAAPFRPFYISAPSSISKSGLVPSCLGAARVFPNSLPCHPGMFNKFPPLYFLGAKDVMSIHTGVQHLSFLLHFSFPLFGQGSFSWPFLPHQQPVSSTGWFVCIDLFLTFKLLR